MYQARISRVAAEMKAAGMRQLLVSDPMAIYYLTGIRNNPMERFWALLIREDGSRVLFSNKLFNIPTVDYEVVTLDDTDDVAENVCRYLVSGLTGVDKELRARFLLPIMAKKPDITCAVGSDCVDDVRARKDEEERRRMRRSSEINDICMKELIAYIHEGCTEKELADFLCERYAAHGCEGLAFDPGISFGANAADPHHGPDGTVLKEGDCIVIDVGCKKDDYCSDMTRTFFWKKADPKHAAIYNTVREANEMAEAKIRPGVRFCELDATARDHIAETGYGEYFTHRLGHFIGMDDHEKGDVSQTNGKPVMADQCFSIEPGVYLPGEFGCRVEDVVMATEDGVEVLNHVSKELTILGL